MLRLLIGAPGRQSNALGCPTKAISVFARQTLDTVLQSPFQTPLGIFKTAATNRNGHLFADACPTIRVKPERTIA